MDPEYTVAIHQAPPGERSPAEPKNSPERRGPAPPKPPPAPVLGWLVCVAGDRRGQDIPIARQRAAIAELYGASATQTPSPVLARDPASGTWTLEEDGGQRALRAYDAIGLPAARLLFIPYEDAP